VKKNPVVVQTPAANQNRLRMNFVVMNMSLAFLYHPIPDESRQSLDSRGIQQIQQEGGETNNQLALFTSIKNYIYQELLQKESRKYAKFPYLIPLSYQIMKKIFLLSDSEQREKLLLEICQQAGNSVNLVV
jgi:hypothetical protein